MFGQRLPCLETECRHLVVVQVLRQLQMFVVGGAINLEFLAVDVAGILRHDFDLLHHHDYKCHLRRPVTRSA